MNGPLWYSDTDIDKYDIQTRIYVSFRCFLGEKLEFFTFET